MADDDSDAYKIRLRPDALARMDAAAKLAGEKLAPGKNGHPNASGLLGGLRNGVPQTIFATEGYAPGSKTLGRMAHLHARRRGISWYEALGELCYLPAEAPSEPEQAAAA